MTIIRLTLMKYNFVNILTSPLILISALLLINIDAISACPFQAAQCNGVNLSYEIITIRLRLIIYHIEVIYICILTLPLVLVSAPLHISRVTISVYPFSTASCIGFFPFY